MILNKIICGYNNYSVLDKNISLITWNILAPSLSKTNTRENFNLRYGNIKSFMDKIDPFYTIVNFTEVDQFVTQYSLPDKFLLSPFVDVKDKTYFYDAYIKNSFNDRSFIYCPKPKSVSTSIPIRHGNLLMFNKQCRIMEIYNFQYASKYPNNQCVILTNLLINKVPFTVVSVHLVSGTNEEKINARKIQLSYVYEKINKYAYSDNIILMGDFNENNMISNEDYIPLKINTIYPPYQRSQANNPSKSGNAKDNKENNEILDYIIFHKKLYEKVKKLSTTVYTDEDKFEGDIKQDKSDHYPITAKVRFKELVKFSESNNEIFIKLECNMEASSFSFLKKNRYIYSSLPDHSICNVVTIGGSEVEIQSYQELQSLEFFVNGDDKGKPNLKDQMNLIHLKHKNKNIIILTYLLFRSSDINNDMLSKILNSYLYYLKDYIIIFMGNKEVDAYTNANMELKEKREFTVLKYNENKTFYTLYYEQSKNEPQLDFKKYIAQYDISLKD